MKISSAQVFIAVVAVAALLHLPSCASKPENERNTSTAFTQGVPGGTWVESYKVPVTVSAIDRASRKITLVAADKSQNTFTAGPDFNSFDQIRVGDQLQAAVARELVVFVRHGEKPPEADTSVAKEMIKDGNYSALLKADTVEKTAKVTAINSTRSEATLQFADGTTRTVSVRRDVDLSNYKIGDEVVIRTRSAAVLNLEKP